MNAKAAQVHYIVRRAPSQPGPPCSVPICRGIRPATRLRCRAEALQVLIVGAGVVGLSCAASILSTSKDTSVTIFDQQQLCKGATGAGLPFSLQHSVFQQPPQISGAPGLKRYRGAGQGYLWLAHRSPGTPAWKLAVDSLASWQDLLLEPDRRSLVGWQESGSLLIARAAESGQGLLERQNALAAAGIEAAVMSAKELQAAEPALRSSEDFEGLLVPGDAQLDGRQAAQLLLSICIGYGARFDVKLQQQVQEVLLDSSGQHAVGLLSNGQQVMADAVVVAAGAWSGQLLATIPPLAGQGWDTKLLPRRGHLLEVVPPSDMPALRHGLMEAEYAQHYTSAAPADPATCDFTFTATASPAGTLLIGSSREFSGWDVTPSPKVVAGILNRAAAFLPDLQQLSPGAASQQPGIRVGLRPFSVCMQPMIGPVPGAGSLYVAAGHEGSGLTLGPGTGDLIAKHILSPDSLPDYASAFLP